MKRMKITAAIILVLAVLMLAAGCTIVNSGNTSAAETQSSSAAETTAAAAEAEATPEPEIIEELSGVMTAEEVAALDEYPDLKTLDVSGSTCYDAIMEYIAGHPDVAVTYTVELADGTVLAGDAAEAEAGSAAAVNDLAAKAAYLPNIAAIRVTGSDAVVAEINALSEAYPDAAITTDYTVTLFGEALASDTRELDLSAMESADVSAAAEALSHLPVLESVELMAEDGTAKLTLDEVKTLIDANSGAAYNYSFEFLKQTVSLADERLEFSKNDLVKSNMDQIRALLPYMNRLNYLLIEDCNVDNDTMAQLRDDFPDIKVVWRIYFGVSSLSGRQYSCLTDTEKIWATGTVTDAYTVGFKYCTEVKYLDLGHNCITNIDFVSYMPKLEVAVLSISWIKDISPLANCPNLEYLEIFSTRVSDISPLAQCTNLQYLNISNIPRYEEDPNVPRIDDISCLYGLTNLKRLYCAMNNVPQEQQDKFKELLPDCEFEFGNVDPSKGGWRFVDGKTFDDPQSEEAKANRNERYALLAEQMGYDTADYSYR